MNAQDLLRIAEGLARGAIGDGRGRPRQAELRRAISAAYYAMFHALARCGADLLVGTTRTSRSQPARHQVYRALEHGHARNQCNSRTIVSRFPQSVQNFAELFTEMQRLRQSANYDPASSFSRAYVINLVSETTRAVTRFDSADARDRRAFAVFVLFRLRSG